MTDDDKHDHHTTCANGDKDDGDGDGADNSADSALNNLKLYIPQAPQTFKLGAMSANRLVAQNTMLGAQNVADSPERHTSGAQNFAESTERHSPGAHTITLGAHNYADSPKRDTLVRKTSRGARRLSRTRWARRTLLWARGTSRTRPRATRWARRTSRWARITSRARWTRRARWARTRPSASQRPVSRSSPKLDPPRTRSPWRAASPTRWFFRATAARRHQHSDCYHPRPSLQRGELNLAHTGTAAACLTRTDGTHVFIGAQGSTFSEDMVDGIALWAEKSLQGGA
jgi:hypothetical protein